MSNHNAEKGACPTCGPTTLEQHPRRPDVVRCVNCKEHLPTAETAAIRARLAENLWAWGWHPDGALDPDGDPVREGYGHHMSQMLYRLPRDGQTDDMRRSIQSMLGDLHALLDLSTPPGSRTPAGDA